MGWPISKIETELSGWEYEFYKVAEKLEMYGEKRADYRAARIMQATSSIMAKRVPPMKEILDLFEFGPGIEQSDERVEVIFGQIKAVNS